MARGGIYDHLGGGFARYSTDERWLVPHFEKMLYDNALLASVYTEAFQLTGEARYSQVARETLDYLLGRMTAAEGAFYSTEDADSEGEEGKYYVWSLPEINQVLGLERGKTIVLCLRHYGGRQLGITKYPQPSSPTRPGSQSALAQRGRFGRRTRRKSRPVAGRARQRVPPGKDTKVLVSWNGLLIAALAVAGRALKTPRYIDVAAQAAGFILDRMRTEGGLLLHTYKDGQAKLNAYLDDYTNLIDGLTRLYEATGEPRWIEGALDLARVLIDEFADVEQGGFFYTGKSHEPLIARTKDLFDNATPSGNAMAATALLRLGALTGRDDLRRAGRSALDAVQTVLENAPSAAGQSLVALDFDLSAVRELAVISGADPQEFRDVIEAIYARFLPGAVVAPATAAQAARLAAALPLLADRPARDQRTTTYICENLTCKEPVVGVEGVTEALGRLVTDFSPGR